MAYSPRLGSAACCALVLEKCLKQDDPTTARFARRFFRAQAKFLATPWTMATSRDLEQAEVVGKDVFRQPSRMAENAQKVGTYYFTQIALAVPHDPIIGAKLFEVINLSIHPTALVSDPRILARVIRARLLQKLMPTPIDHEAMADYPPAPARA